MQSNARFLLSKECKTTEEYSKFGSLLRRIEVDCVKHLPPNCNQNQLKIKFKNNRLEILIIALTSLPPKYGFKWVKLQ